MQGPSQTKPPGLLILASPAWQERVVKHLGLDKKAATEWQAQEPAWMDSVYQLAAEAILREQQGLASLALVLVDGLAGGEMRIFTMLRQLAQVRAGAFSLAAPEEKLRQAEQAGAAIFQPGQEEAIELLWRELRQSRAEATLEIVNEEILDGPMLKHDPAQEKLARQTVTELAQEEIKMLREKEAQEQPPKKDASEKEKPTLSREELDALLGP